MPSTFTAQNRLEEQNPGENLNTWGSRLNANTTALIDFAISGYTALSISGAITLTSANGAADQARSAILDFTAGSGGTVAIPGVSHVYQVRNGANGNVVFTTGSGPTATVEPGSFATVVCDGTNCYRLADAADIAACLAAAELYAQGLAFESSSGQLPGQAGNAGAFLMTNGTTAMWTAPLPNQTGQNGGLLQTNGSSASWNTGVSSSLANVSTLLAGVSTSLTAVQSGQGAAWFTQSQASGTDGPDTGGPSAWTLRSINTTGLNTIGGASLASSQIVLPAGTYEADIVTVFNDTNTSSDGRKARLRNITDAATALVSLQGYQGGAFNDNILLKGLFTITATKTFQIQNWAANGYAGGVAASSGEVELYLSAFFRKLA